MKHKTWNKTRLKTFLKFFFTLFFIASCFMFHASLTHGINMESPRFRIQFSNLNTASGTKSSEGYSLSDTVGQLAAGRFDSEGYVVKAGFQYLHSIIPFRFTITDTTIDFGPINPKTFSAAKTNLIVSFGSAGNYQVTANEEGKLRSASGNTIPDTTCNGKSHTCSENVAKPWTSLTAYGFGYHLEGDDAASDFIDSTYFRPFPDSSEKKPPAVVMSNVNVGKNRTATVTFKVNVSPDQVAGTYQTVINFTATPSF